MASHCKHLLKLFSTSVLLKTRGVSSLTWYKSIYSLDKIYPKSTLDISKVPEVKEIKPGAFSGYIPIDRLTISYCRSSGPGGQNVNKVNTKAEVKFHLESAEWIPEHARQKMMELHKRFINKEGMLLVRSDKTRTQTLNLADCMDKLRCMIREAEKPPPELSSEAREVIRRRQEKAAAATLRMKRERSLIKRNREVPEIHFS